MSHFVCVSEMSYQFPGVDLNPDSMRYHVEDDASANFDWFV